MVFATCALDLLRTFLPPLYAFATSGPRDSVRPVPAYVSFFLRITARSVEQERHTQYGAAVVREEGGPRVDAQASDDRTSVGGWLPAAGPDGRPDPAYSYWFSEEVTEQDFPWVSRKDGKAASVIATLEALAMLLAVRALFPGAQGNKRTTLTVVTSYTDNRCNGSLLNKLMSSKYPLSALLMEFSEQLRHSGVRPDVRWTPREANCEAGRLANGTHRGSVHLFVFGCSHQKEAGSSSTMLFFSGQTQKIRRGSSERKAVGTGRSRARGKSRRTCFASKTRGEFLSRAEKESRVIHAWCSRHVEWLLVVAHSVVRRLPSSRPCSSLLLLPFSPPGVFPYFFLCFNFLRTSWTIVFGVQVKNLGRIAGALVAGWTRRSSELSFHQIPHRGELGQILRRLSPFRGGYLFR